MSRKYRTDLLRFMVSQVPKGEAPGAPSFNGCVYFPRHLGHPSERESSVEDWPPESPCPVRRWTRFSHKLSAFHRVFRGICGRRGKQGQCDSREWPVLKKPRIAQTGFRKLDSQPTPYPPISSEAFPLFLGELRVLLSFLLIYSPISSYPVALWGQARRPVGSTPAVGRQGTFGSGQT
jgi:hypothetical protein